MPGKLQQIGPTVAQNHDTEDEELDDQYEEQEEAEADQPQSIVHLISDFVIELLEALDIPQSQINELVAKLEIVQTMESPEELMVHLCQIGQKIIQGKNDEAELFTRTTKEQVRLQAARMALCYLALLN